MQGLEQEVMGSRLDLERWMDGQVTGDELQQARRELVRRCDATFLKKDREQWTALFDAKGVWYERVQTYQEVVDDPQAQASFSPMADDAHGTYAIVNAPMTFSCSPQHGPNKGGAPTVGEHNHQIAELVGYSPEEVAELETSGVLSVRNSVKKRLT